jgi:hypothetical protein
MKTRRVCKKKWLRGSHLSCGAKLKPYQATPKRVRTLHLYVMDLDTEIPFVFHFSKNVSLFKE